LSWFVREGNPDDLERVAEIKVHSWSDTYSAILEPDALRPFLDHDKQLAYIRHAVAQQTTALLVAQDASGLVVGFALAYLEPDREPWLESLHVGSDLRGHGVGTLLMRSLAAHLKSRGHNTMRLGVIVGNHGAARLYQRLGAKLIDIEPVSWAQGVQHEIYAWSDLTPLAT
jgi:2-amino-4-hydroxy-6-hydroxymethyldihydropteridine diphosphokinase